RVAIGQELHRAFDVGEQHGDELALALELGACREDLVGEVLRGVALRIGEAPAGRRRADRQRRAAAAAEARLGRHLGAAARAGACQSGAALLAEPGAFAATCLAAQTRPLGASWSSPIGTS